jgi:ferric-dicitrate binding protein FerR (iron transport regulator)
MARVRAPTLDPLVGRTLAEAAAAPPSIPKRALPTFDGAGATINNILRIGATPEDEAEEAAADAPAPARPQRRRSVVPLVVVTGIVLALAALGGATVVAIGVAVLFTLSR